MPNTKSITVFLALTLLIVDSAFAAQPPQLLFADDFERQESQETKDELGNGWGTNSENRAGGNKQVDLGDGILHVFKHKTADHNVSITHEAAYKDCRVELRFRLDHEGDDLGIDFADMDFPGVHAGHICKVFFRPSEIEMLDFKFGRMNKAYKDAAKAGTASKQQKADLKNFQKKIDHVIELNKWHDLSVTIIGDTMAVELDGAKVGAFSSPGMDHPDKDMIRFSARREVRLDDLKMYALDPMKGPSARAGNKPMADQPTVKHLFVAKLLLRKFDSVDLTGEQLAAFNRLSEDLRTMIDRKRDAVGITAETIKKRDEVYSKMKKSEPKDDAFWNLLQEKAGITAAQRDVFRETMEHYKTFRARAMNLLTEEQRKRLPKGKKAASK